MPFVQSTLEKQAAHKAGQSAGVAKRVLAASQNTIQGAGDQLALRSQLPTIAGAALASGTAYWVYVGRAAEKIAAARVRAYVTSAGAGAQTAEVAVATSATPPNGAAQALTVVAVSGSLDALTATGTKGCSADLAVAIDPSSYVWVGIRTAMATTQPSVQGHTMDCLNGECLSTAAAGVLAVGTSYAGALIADSVAWQAPALFLTVTQTS